MLSKISIFKNYNEDLEDRNKIKCFQNTIFLNKYKFKNKILYDFASPYGIYAMFALKCNSKLVIVKTKKNFSSYIRTIYQDNGFLSEKFIIIEDDLSNIDLCLFEHSKKSLLKDILLNKKIDAIVGEWHGNLLVDSNKIDKIIKVRDKYLKTKIGFIFPNKGKLILNFVEDSNLYSKKIEFWKNVYRFTIENVIPLFVQEGHMDKIKKSMIRINDFCLHQINMMTVKSQNINFVQYYTCTIKSDCLIHIKCINFEIKFDNCHHVVKLSNSAFTKNINYNQCLLYLNKPMKLKRDKIFQEI